MWKKLGLFIISITGFLGVSNLALAASYHTNVSFEVRLIGESRYYDGQNLAYKSGFAKSYPEPHKILKTYTVTLKRDKWGLNETIGTGVLMRDSSGLIEWSNVGPGYYYFVLEKANDGITLVDENVSLFNY